DHRPERKVRHHDDRRAVNIIDELPQPGETIGRPAAGADDDSLTRSHRPLHDPWRYLWMRHIDKHLRVCALLGARRAREPCCEIEPGVLVDNLADERTEPAGSTGNRDINTHSFSVALW